MGMQRRFFNCLMIMGALQSFVFCSESKYVINKEDEEVARYLGCSCVGVDPLEWSDSPDSAYASSKKIIESVPYSHEIAPPRDVHDIKSRLSNDRKRLTTSSKGVISHSVEGANTIKPFVGNRARSYAVANVFLETDEESKDER